MAINTDKFKKGARKWVGQIGSGGVADDSVTTIPLASTTNLPTDTAIDAVINRVDANGTATPTAEETVTGVVSGTNLVTCTRGVEGTAQAHSAGSVVEILLTSNMWDDMVDGILVQHNQLGLHTDITACDITASGTVTALTATVTGQSTLSDVSACAVTATSLVSGSTLASSDIEASNITATTVVKTDTISELTAAAGVTIDGLQIKDGAVVYGDSAPNIAPKCRAYLDSAQTITKATWVKIALDAETYDVGGDFDSATNNQFTAPVTGYYMVTGCVTFTSPVVDKRYFAAIDVDAAATPPIYHPIHSSSTSTLGVQISDVVYLTAAQTVQLYAYTDSTSDEEITTGSLATYMSIHLLSV